MRKQTVRDLRQSHRDSTPYHIILAFLAILTLAVLYDTVTRLNDPIAVLGTAFLVVACSVFVAAIGFFTVTGLLYRWRMSQRGIIETERDVAMGLVMRSDIVRAEVRAVRRDL